MKLNFVVNILNQLFVTIVYDCDIDFNKGKIMSPLLFSLLINHVELHLQQEPSVLH